MKLLEADFIIEAACNLFMKAEQFFAEFVYTGTSLPAQ